MFLTKTATNNATCKGTTIISEGCELGGDLVLDCPMQVYGQLQGHIRCSHSVTINQPGKVLGKIVADHIIVKGEVEGEFYADRVDVLQSGLIRGTIYSDNLSIEQGGRFIGEVHAASSQQQQRPQSKPAAIARTQDAAGLTLQTTAPSAS